MCAYRCLKRRQAWSLLLLEWEINLFLKNYFTLERAISHNVYTINSSPLLITKYVFMLATILSKYQKCPVSFNLWQTQIKEKLLSLRRCRTLLLLTGLCSVRLNTSSLSWILCGSGCFKIAPASATFVMPMKPYPLDLHSPPSVSGGSRTTTHSFTVPNVVKYSNTSASVVFSLSSPPNHNLRSLSWFCGRKQQTLINLYKTFLN